MNIRLQTWFPYHIQICLNGRERLRRSLEKNGVEFVAKGNKFLHVAYNCRSRMGLGAMGGGRDRGVSAGGGNSLSAGGQAWTGCRSADVHDL